MEFPGKNVVVSHEDLLVICGDYGLTKAAYVIKELPPEKPFKSDGASFFPDEIMGVDLYPATFLHDIDYWCGVPGDEQWRLESDERLQRNVIAMCRGSEELASLIFCGVRIGGQSGSGLPWQWGFGRA